MTCRELLKKQHPDWSEGAIGMFIDVHCPSIICGIGDPDGCVEREDNDDVDCSACWDREIPGTMVTVGEDIPDNPNRKVDTLVKASGTPDFAKEANDAFRKMFETISKTGDSIVQLGNAAATIKDSGDRTQFETGAVRDMREGKGRCDLMPLEVISKCWLHRAGGDEDTEAEARVFYYINGFQKTRETSYLVKALDYFPAYEGWSTMFLEVAKHFEDGAKKYGENNWQKGIPVHCYIDSAIRHYLKWLRGDKDEPHDRAFVWNLMCCIWEVDYREMWVEEETPEPARVPVTKCPEMVRLGDCKERMFEFSGETYIRTDIPAGNAIYSVDLDTGRVRHFDPDILVTPLEMWAVDDDEG